MNLAPERLPLIPEKILRRHKVCEPYDTRFRSAARLRQALWREEQGLPIGHTLTAAGRLRPLGSRISSRAGLTGANLINPALTSLVERELAYREPGSMFDVRRLQQNLLSSMPLAFSLFGPLKQDRALGLGVLTSAFPAHLAQVDTIEFEHSPGRADEAFTNDHSAFDVFIRGKDASGMKTFVAIEVKYSESMAEPAARLRPRYDSLSQSCGLYEAPDAVELREPPIQQLWREHMLAASMVAEGLYDHGLFAVLAPRLNTDVQRAVACYVGHLAGAEPKVAFENLALEGFIKTIGEAGSGDLSGRLHDRYCDFSAVHALI